MRELFGSKIRSKAPTSLLMESTWKQVLSINKEVGAFDLIFDPNNSRILYASTWRIKRTPYSWESGGPGSGIWKSADGGDPWKQLPPPAPPSKGGESTASPPLE